MGAAKQNETDAEKAEAIALAGKIRDLRSKAAEHRALAEQQRTHADTLRKGSYEASFSLFIAQDHEEKADAADEDSIALVRKHAKAMEPFSKHTTWETNGVTACCECGEPFFIETLGGRFLERRCPLCGKRVHEWGYDDRGRRLAYKLGIAKRNNHEDAHMIEADLKRLALARYLASEWYLLSGTPSCSRGFDIIDEGYSFTPCYDVKGQFCLKANYGHHIVHGITGEMTLFDLLRTCVNNRQSPLYGGKIVPNTFLAKSKVERGHVRVRRNQTDCIFLHPEGAIAFEVKRWHSSIRVDAVRGEVVVTKKGNVTRYSGDEGPSVQAMAARKALLSEIEGLNGRRACGMVTFVDPLNVSGDPGALPSRKHVCFGELYKGGTGTTLKKIEECINVWRERSDGVKKLDASAIAEKLLDECSCYALPIDPKGKL